MRCNICGSMDADIRPSELTTARISLRAHVDCNGHGQYRPVSREEIKEATNKEARILNAIPEMYELIKRAGDIMIELESLLDTALLNDASAQKSQWHKDVAKLLGKIEGGGE